MSLNESKAMFSIKELERLTGIKAHTLRVWEQRYGIIKPQRTETNIRFYSEDDLKGILNIALLNANGMKISKIAAMTHEEINHSVIVFTDNYKENDELLNALTLSMLELDEDRFEKILSNVIIKLGFEYAVVQIIYPFLERIGLLWQTNTIVPAQEHFISNLIRHKLIAAADGQVVNYKANAKKFVLFLPEGEFHEVGLLFGNYLIKKYGHRVVYLGQTVPFEDLAVIANIYQADVFLTAFTFFIDEGGVLKYMDKLSKQFPKSKILVTGSMLNDLDVESRWNNLTQIKNINDLQHFLSSLNE